MASTPDNTHATTQVAQSAHQDPNPMTPDVWMVVWTWVTFAIVAVVLYKIAWKPILAALDAREQRIRSSLDDARRAKEELENIEETCNALKMEAANASKEIVAKARAAATEAASHVEAKSSEKIAIMYENAERDIDAMTNKVVADMRKDQADIIVNLASRLVASNLDTDSNRALTDKLLKEL